MSEGGKIATLRIAHAMSPDARPGVVAILEDLLRRARAGEVHSVAIAYGQAGGEGEDDGTVSLFEAPDCAKAERLLGCVRLLDFRIARMLLGNMHFGEDPRDPKGAA